MTTQTQGPDNGQNRNQLATAEGQNRWIASLVSGQLASVLPKHITAERMIRVVYGEFRRNPKLAQCSQTSLGLSLLTAAQLGLEPSGPLGHAYLIPRWNKDTRGLECGIQVGYKGLLELMRRSGQIAQADAAVVYEGEDFEVVRGSSPDITHRPSITVSRDDDRIVAAYCVVKTKDGGTYFDFVTRAEIEKRKSRSETAGKSFSPWASDYAAMARKSAIRKLLNGGMVPMSSELIHAFETDDDEVQERAWREAEVARGGGSTRAGDYLNVEPEPTPAIPERAGFADEGPARESAPVESAPADDGGMP